MAHILTTFIPRIKRRKPGLLRYLDLHAQRRTLAKLDPHLLRDIGLTRHQAMTEAKKPIWHAPDHWKC